MAKIDTFGVTMPALSPVQQQLIDIFASKEEFVNLAFILNNGGLPHKELFKSLCEIALGNPDTAQGLLQTFNPQNLDAFINNPPLNDSQATTFSEILKKIKTAIAQGKKQSHPLVPTTGNQAAAIALLWDSEFLTICFEIFNQNHSFPLLVPPALIDKYASYLHQLRTIALGTTTEREIAFLVETHDATVNFAKYLTKLPITEQSLKWENFFGLLKYKFKHPSIISRLAGVFITLLIFPFLAILFLNPIKLLLSNIASKNYLFGFLATALYPLFLLIQIMVITSFGYMHGFELTLKNFTGLISKDFRYTLLSFLIIGLGVASALTLVLFPPAVPFLLSLPLLSSMSSISLPWLAVIAGTTIGLLATLITASITWFATRNTNSFSSTADFRNIDTAPLTAATDNGHSPEAQAALALTSSPPFKTLPNMIEVTTHSVKAPSLQSKIYKNKGARYGEYPFYIVYDDHQIYINCMQECNTGTIKFKFLSEAIVIENGQCKTALPPYIKFLPDQYKAEFTDLVIDVQGYPRSNNTIYKGKLHLYRPFNIFNDGKQIRIECIENVTGTITVGSLLLHLKNGRHDSEHELSNIKIIPYQSPLTQTSKTAPVMQM